MLVDDEIATRDVHTWADAATRAEALVGIAAGAVRSLPLDRAMEVVVDLARELADHGVGSVADLVAALPWDLLDEHVDDVANVVSMATGPGGGDVVAVVD